MVKNAKILSPFAGIYNGVTSLRNYFFNIDLKKTIELDIPVISVGNITAGGTGKTPFTITLAKLLVEKGFKPAIITRGYKRKSKGQIIVSNGNGPTVPVEISGDEPFLMAEKTDNVVIIADKDRVSAGKTVIEKFDCDIIIADDCFQHRRLFRDVNIILWDSYTSPFEEYLLPKGRLRESFSGLLRGDFMVFTRTEKPDEKDVKFFNQKGLECYTSPTRITSIKNISGDLDQSEVENKKILAFCGLGNHQQFFDTVQQLNPNKLITQKFSDHHKYSNRQIDELFNKLKEDEIDYLITTEKDRTNIPTKYLNNEKLLFLSIELEIGNSLLQRILKNI